MLFLQKQNYYTLRQDIVTNCVSYFRFRRYYIMPQNIFHERIFKQLAKICKEINQINKTASTSQNLHNPQDAKRNRNRPFFSSCPSYDRPSSRKISLYPERRRHQRAKETPNFCKTEAKNCFNNYVFYVRS